MCLRCKLSGWLRGKIGRYGKESGKESGQVRLQRVWLREPSIFRAVPGVRRVGHAGRDGRLARAARAHDCALRRFAALPFGMQRPESLATISREGFQRVPLAMGEMNRVLGGGLVPGSLVLVGGDPGIGKSTLLLQVAALLGASAGPVLYVSAEDRRSRSNCGRNGSASARSSCYVIAETDIETILAHAAAMQPKLLVVDSIQTVALDTVASTAGSVTQVRESTAA